jgi:hypothetical protein
VKNDNLLSSTLQRQLDVLKITGEKLFAFTDVKLDSFSITGVHEDAAFLFKNIVTLRLSIGCPKFAKGKKSVNLKKIVDAFDRIAITKFHIALEFPYDINPTFSKSDRALIPRISGLKLRGVKIFTDLHTIHQMLRFGAGKDAKPRRSGAAKSFPAITDFVLENCEMEEVNAHDLAFYFPQLKHLHIRSMDEFSTAPLLLISKSFLTMSSMRVLKLDRVAVQSFDVIDSGRMPLLEELYVKLDNRPFCKIYGRDRLTRIGSFPHFPKLTKLKLRLCGVDYIDPRAFDHLTQLTRFEIQCLDVEADTFETGVVARSMSFFFYCTELKLTSNRVSEIEEISMENRSLDGTLSLKTLLPLSGLKILTASKWAVGDLPFHQMTNLVYFSSETIGLEIIKTDEIKCLSKLRFLEVNRNFFSSAFF